VGVAKGSVDTTHRCGAAKEQQRFREWKIRWVTWSREIGAF
jgi:hypothetical protein